MGLNVWYEFSRLPLLHVTPHWINYYYLVSSAHRHLNCNCRIGCAFDNTMTIWFTYQLLLSRASLAVCFPHTSSLFSVHINTHKFHSETLEQLPSFQVAVQNENKDTKTGYTVMIHIYCSRKRFFCSQTSITVHEIPVQSSSSWFGFHSTSQRKCTFVIWPPDSKQASKRPMCAKSLTNCHCHLHILCICNYVS